MQQGSVESETKCIFDLASGLLSHLRAGGESRTAAIEQFRELAFAGKRSSWAAQHALEEASTAEAAALVTSLHGHVLVAMHCMYANYVLQKIIEIMPAASSSFIAHELLCCGHKVARHKFGCRILCRLLEHSSPSDPDVAQLLNEVLDDAAQLSQHCFGNYVIAHFLTMGHPDHQKKVLNALRPNLFNIAKTKKGSQVVGVALTQKFVHEGRTIADDLLASRSELLSLASNQYGCHLVTQLMSMVEFRRRAAAMLIPASPPSTS